MQLVDTVRQHLIKIKTRFLQKYQMRDMSVSEINELWCMREKNEDSVLQQFAEGVDFVFNNKEN